MMVDSIKTLDSRSNIVKFSVCLVSRFEIFFKNIFLFENIFNYFFIFYINILKSLKNIKKILILYFLF